MLRRPWPHRAIRNSAQAALLVVAALIVGSCAEPDRAVAPTARAAAATPLFTAGQGSTPTLLGLANYADFDKVKRIAKDWHVELKAKGGLEVVIRSFAYEVGAYTGWHKHPGPVLIQVIEGTITFFEADDPCTPIVVSAGQGYIDTGEHGHIGRNLSGARARDITIYLVPPGTPVTGLRLDMDEPRGAAACR